MTPNLEKLFSEATIGPIVISGNFLSSGIPNMSVAECDIYQDAHLFALLANHGRALIEALERSGYLLEQYAGECKNSAAAYQALENEQLLAILEQSAKER